MDISVIIPSYNRLESLKLALASVQRQSAENFEICVVDDGSTDGTGDWIRHNCPQAIYHYQKNQGVSAARNKGIALTSGSWLAFLDSDDTWLPGKLERQWQEVESNDEVHLLHCDERWIRNGRHINQGKRHRKSGGDIFEESLALCLISPSAVMLRRSLFNELGGFDEELPACEDYDLWLRICSRYRVHFIDEVLVEKTGGHADQLSRKFWGMDRFRVRALEKLLMQGGLNLQQRGAAIDMLSAKSRVLANGAAKRGKIDDASSYLEKIDRWNVNR